MPVKDIVWDVNKAYICVLLRDTVTLSLRDSRTDGESVSVSVALCIGLCKMLGYAGSLPNCVEDHVPPTLHVPVPDCDSVCMSEPVRVDDTLAVSDRVCVLLAVAVALPDCAWLDVGA